MTTDGTTGLLAGLALAALVMVLARIGLSGGALRQEKDCRVVCPRFREPVDCTLVQDVRTGQWKDVLSCGAFMPPGTLLCDRECARAMNLGFGLDGAAATASPAREV
jgi:hypothetical protein